MKEFTDFDLVQQYVTLPSSLRRRLLWLFVVTCRSNELSRERRREIWYLKRISRPGEAGFQLGRKNTVRGWMAWRAEEGRGRVYM